MDVRTAYRPAEFLSTEEKSSARNLPFQENDFIQHSSVQSKIIWVEIRMVGIAETKIVTKNKHREPSATNPDQELVNQAAAGDAIALAALYDKHVSAIFSLAVRIVEDESDAENIVQEVFLEAKQKAAQYDATRTSIAIWLLLMTRTRAIAFMRERRLPLTEPSRNLSQKFPLTSQPSSTLMATVTLPDPVGEQSCDVQSPEEIRRLRELWSALPRIERLAIELAYFEGQTLAEIAKEIEQPIELTMKRIQDGLSTLGAGLKDIEK